MAPLQYVFVYVSSDYNFWKILLQYVFANVSLDGQFREILPHTPWAKKYVLLLFRWLLYVNPAPHSMHMSLKMTTSGKYCPELLAKKISSMFCQLCLQILHHTLCICLFKWLPYGNLFFCMCCHMCLQVTSLCKSCTTLFAAKCIFFIMYTCIRGKYCPTLIAKKSFCFLLSGMCCHMCLQMTSLCKSHTTLFAA